jgi:hypothetical protein
MTTVAGRDGGVRNDVVALAEKVLALLGEGRYTATYKYAVLLALMDLCLEKTQADGAAPDMVTTRELAERVVATTGPTACRTMLRRRAACSGRAWADAQDRRRSSA